MRHEDVCILFDSHGVSDFISTNFERYRRAAEGVCPIYLCNDSGFDDAPAVSGPVLNLSREEIFGAFDHRKGDHVIPGNPDLKLLAAARQLSQFKRFIRIEFDVLPLGAPQDSIRRLAEIAGKADLATSYLGRYTPDSRWGWWTSLSPPESVKITRSDLESKLSRGFFPISTFSRDSLEIYEGYLRRGWTGHYEVLLPTVANLERRRIVNLSVRPYEMTNRIAFSTRVPHPDDVPEGSAFAHKVKDEVLARALLGEATGPVNFATRHEPVSRPKQAALPEPRSRPGAEAVRERSERPTRPAVAARPRAAVGRVPSGAADAARPSAQPDRPRPTTALPLECGPLSEPGEVGGSEVPIWSTKGPHFWAFLSALLIKARPRSILEIGTGRSTTFLADYAIRSRARFIAVEENEVWHRKVTTDLRFMRNGGNYVHHVPVVSNGEDRPWYDMKRMRRLLGGTSFDLVFVDGPQGAARVNREGRKLIATAARDARLIIVDDVHRSYNMDFFNELSTRFPGDGRFFYEYNRNALAIGADECRHVVRSCFDFLEVPYQSTLATREVEGDEDG